MLSPYFRIRESYSCSDSMLLKLVDAEKNNVDNLNLKRETFKKF